MTKSTLPLIGSSLSQTDQLIRNRSLDLLRTMLNSKIGNHNFSTTIRKTPQYTRSELRGKNRVGKFQRKKKKESFFSSLGEKKLSFFSVIFLEKKKNFLFFLTSKKLSFLFFSLDYSEKFFFLFFSQMGKIFFFSERKFFFLPIPGPNSIRVHNFKTT